VSGITNADLKKYGAQKYEVIGALMNQKIAVYEGDTHYPVVGHNIHYDLRALITAAETNNLLMPLRHNPKFCTKFYAHESGIQREQLEM